MLIASKENAFLQSLKQNKIVMKLYVFEIYNVQKYKIIYKNFQILILFVILYLICNFCVWHFNYYYYKYNINLKCMHIYLSLKSNIQSSRLVNTLVRLNNTLRYLIRTTFLNDKIHQKFSTLKRDIEFFKNFSFRKSIYIHIL